MRMKCVVLKFSATKGWKQTTNDREASDQLAQSNSCDADLCEVTLKLFNNDCTKAIGKLYTYTRDELKRLTIPSGYESEFVVPTGTYEKVRALIDDSKAKLEVLLQDMGSHWDEYIQNETRLGRFFDGSKYPKADTIIANTRIATKFAPMSEKHQFVGLFDNSDKEDELQAMHDAELDDIKVRTQSELLSRIESACLKTISILERYHANDGRKRIATDDVFEALSSRISDIVPLNFLGSPEVAEMLSDVNAVIRDCDHVQFKNKQYAEAFVLRLKTAIKQVAVSVVTPKILVPTVIEEVAAPVVKVTTPTMRRINLSDLD